MQGTCVGCETESKALKWCAKCQLATYCSKACQRKDWKSSHKEVCAQRAKVIHDLQHNSYFTLLQSSIWLLREHFLFFQVQFKGEIRDSGIVNFRGVQGTLIDALEAAHKKFGVQLEIDRNKRCLVEIFPKRQTHGGVCIALPFTKSPQELEAEEAFVSLFLDHHFPIGKLCLKSYQKVLEDQKKHKDQKELLQQYKLSTLRLLDSVTWFNRCHSCGWTITRHSDTVLRIGLKHKEERKDVPWDSVSVVVLKLESLKIETLLISSKPRQFTAKDERVTYISHPMEWSSFDEVIKELERLQRLFDARQIMQPQDAPLDYFHFP